MKENPTTIPEVVESLEWADKQFKIAQRIGTAVPESEGKVNTAVKGELAGGFTGAVVMMKRSIAALKRLSIDPRELPKVFVVYLNDRHVDPDFRIFTRPEKAKEWARFQIDDIVKWKEYGPQDIEIDEPEEPKSDRIATSRYGPEGDYLAVIGVPIDGEVR